MRPTTQIGIRYLVAVKSMGERPSPLLAYLAANVSNPALTVVQIASRFGPGGANSSILSLKSASLVRRKNFSLGALSLKHDSERKMESPGSIGSYRRNTLGRNRRARGRRTERALVYPGTYRQDTLLFSRSPPRLCRWALSLMTGGSTWETRLPTWQSLQLRAPSSSDQYLGTRPTPS